MTRFNNLRSSASLVFCCLVLTACSSFKTTPDLGHALYYDWSTVEQKLRKLNRWSLYGKLGIRTDEESITVAINKWDQADDHFEIDLSSTFFGMGAAKLLGNSDFLMIHKSSEQPLSSFEPDNLVETALGIPLPISYLPHWIKGLPTENNPFEQTFNKQGLPESLLQDNWQLSYSQYRTEHNPPLPGKIIIQRDNIRIILAVKAWILP